MGFAVLGGGLRPWSQTMVLERARPWGRGRSELQRNSIIETVRNRSLHRGFCASGTRIWGRILGNPNFGRPNFGRPNSWVEFFDSVLSSKRGPRKIQPREIHLPKFTFQTSTQKSGQKIHMHLCTAICLRNSIPPVSWEWTSLRSWPPLKRKVLAKAMCAWDVQRARRRSHAIATPAEAWRRNAAAWAHLLQQMAFARWRSAGLTRFLLQCLDFCPFFDFLFFHSTNFLLHQTLFFSKCSADKNQIYWHISTS